MDEMSRRLDAMVRKIFAEVESCAEVRDFRLEEREGWYHVIFDDSLGQAPLWDMSPATRFVPEKKGWECRIAGITFVLPTCPLHEYVFEFRPVLLDADLNSADTVLDMGGGSGLFAMYAAKRAGDGEVLCLEPEAETAGLLQTIARVNGLDNLHVEQAADAAALRERLRALRGRMNSVRVAMPHMPPELPEEAARTLAPGGRMAVLCADDDYAGSVSERVGQAGCHSMTVFGYVPTVQVRPHGTSLPELPERRRSLELMRDAGVGSFIMERAEVADKRRSRGHGPKAERPDYPEGSVFLLGLPGSGRERLGQDLARELGLPFVAESHWQAVRQRQQQDGSMVAVIAPDSVREEEGRIWLKKNGRAFYLMNDVWNILTSQGMDPSGEAFELRRSELAKLSSELEPLFMQTVHFPLLAAFGPQEQLEDALEKIRF